MGLTRWQILKGVQPPPPPKIEMAELFPGMLERYRGHPSQRDRGGLVYTDPKAMFLATKVHYHPKLKKYLRCKSEANQEICCARIGLPIWRIGASLIKYDTDKMGNLMAPLRYQVMPWVFGENSYTKLKILNDRFSLATNDIFITCHSIEFQHITLEACTESIWLQNKIIKANVLGQARPVQEFLKKALAVDMPLPELRTLLENDTIPNS